VCPLGTQQPAGCELLSEGRQARSAQVGADKLN